MSTDEKRKSLAAHRLIQATESLEEARYLMGNTGNTGTLPVFPEGWQGVKFKLLSPVTEVKSI